MKVSPKNLLFFTCATGMYKDFVIPYIYFAFCTNRGAAFEVVVDNLEVFNSRHKQALNYLCNLDAEINIRQIPEMKNKPKMANSYRFIIQPEMQREYVYIGDIDIMICEEVFPKHQHVFDKGLPYSNIVRQNDNKLTGLHFCKYEHQYPLPKIDDLIRSIQNDERLLYAIMDRKGLIYDLETYKNITRPVHGLHMSLNRLPFSYNKSRVNWDVDYQKMVLLNQIMLDNDFDNFFYKLHVTSRMILMNLIILSQGVLSFDKKFYCALYSGEDFIEKIEGDIVK